MRTPQFLLTAVLAVLVAGCNSKATVETPAATPVRVATAKSGPAAPSIRTNGLLANKDEIRLSFKVGGVIRKLSVSEGEHVRKGQHILKVMTDMGMPELELRTRELFTECLVTLGALPRGAQFGTLTREEIERYIGE